jgi:hypothetical protein
MPIRRRITSTTVSEISVSTAPTSAGVRYLVTIGSSRTPISRETTAPRP